MNITNKKSFFWMSFILTLISIIFYLNIPYNYLCDKSISWCGDSLRLLKIFLLIFPTVLLFSIVSIYSKDELYYEWKNFNYYFIPLYLFFLCIFPNYLGDEFLNFQSIHILILFTFIYSISSLYLLVFRSFKK
jgi:hypothetical protein